MQATVLIVDDIPANLGILVETLSSTGYRTLIAEDGNDALEQLNHVLPDIILLDIMMPGIDGFETCRRIKKDKRTHHIPVLFMTALSGTSDKIKGFEAGAVDYITKPFNNEEILARIETHLLIRKQQEEIEDQRQELIERSAMQDRFMKIANHDLRNLLAVMNLRCSMLKEEREIPSREELDETIDKLRLSIDRMNDIIHGFLSSAAGRSFEISAGTLDTAKLLEEVVEQYQPSARKKDIKLELLEIENLPAICADGSRIHQVLINYLSNAIKYSPKNSTIKIYAKEDDSFLRISVADEGPGIKESERVNLFKEYAEISTTPTDGEDSTGLGLSIVKRLIEAQGGSVGAFFPKKGTIFWLKIPIAQA